MRDYSESVELQHFVLEESWVLGIAATPGQLEFEMNLVFAKDHPDLRPPRDGEVFYSRTGVLRFRGVTDLVWRGQGKPPATDATGEQDWGAIDSMHYEGNEYLLGGDWGTLTVKANSIEAELTGAAD
jgi:hypothetical protein